MVFTCGSLGEKAVPLLRRLAEATIGDDDKVGKAQPEILGALAMQGKDAVPVARAWAAGDAKERHALANRLTDLLVRHGTSPEILAPITDPMLHGESPAAKVRAAEWLLRVDASLTKPFDLLVGLCEGEDTPDEVRGNAAAALSRRVCLPHNRMTEAMRRRGVQAVVAAIRRGEVPVITIAQCAGMEPFIAADDLVYVDGLLKKMDPKKHAGLHRYRSMLPGE